MGTQAVCGKLQLLSGHRFSDAVSALNSDAPLGLGIGNGVFRQTARGQAESQICVTMLTRVTFLEISMRSTHSMVISMRLPAESGKRLKRMANRHGWTASDASARLVEEGLRRSEFAFIDFRDSPAGRQACLQGSTLAVWEIMLLVHSYKKNVAAVARHLNWPEVKVQAAVNYARAFPEEVSEAMAENEAMDFEALKRMLPQATEFVPRKTAKN